MPKKESTPRSEIKSSVQQAVFTALVSPQKLIFDKTTRVV